MRLMGAATAVGIALLAATPAAAHEAMAEGGLLAGQAQPPRTTGGPCTKAAGKSMPEGGEHDHDKVAHHRMRCRMRQVYFDSLADELADRNDVVLGEMDVKRGLAIVAVTFPEAGFLLFDVKDPAKPKFLSWYRTTECDQLYADINCGAFVDLSKKGDVAFLSIQTLTLFSGAPRPDADPIATPSVEVVDIRDRRNPIRIDLYPVLSEGGVHTTRSHMIPENAADDGPRDPGEYLFSIGNGHGIDIAEVQRSGDAVFLEQVNYIYLGESHDTYIENDPIDGRTYLYVAGGRAVGFEVYDVTDPTQIEPVARWDLTPDCYDDWYAHTIDIGYKGKRRYVTLPVEINNGGEMSDEEKDAGCGKFYGMPDRAGPMWIIDATDWSKLGQINFTGEGESDTGERLAEKSRKTLVTTWTNPAGRAGGNMVFSPHNQQIVGSRIYLSSFHGGVYVLDASAAFSGKRKVPTELGFIIPHGSGERPFFKSTIQPVNRFFTARHGVRPDIWDAYFYKGYVLAADMVGGFYSLQWRGDRLRQRRR